MAHSLNESNKLKKRYFTKLIKEKKRRTHPIAGWTNSDGTINSISNIRRCQNHRHSGIQHRDGG